MTECKCGGEQDHLLPVSKKISNGQDNNEQYMIKPIGVKYVFKTKF